MYKISAENELNGGMMGNIVRQAEFFFYFFSLWAQVKMFERFWAEYPSTKVDTPILYIDFTFV